VNEPAIATMGSSTSSSVVPVARPECACGGPASEDRMPPELLTCGREGDLVVLTLEELLAELRGFASTTRGTGNATPPARTEAPSRSAQRAFGHL
jgi:hypothetical protein